MLLTRSWRLTLWCSTGAKFSRKGKVEQVLLWNFFLSLSFHADFYSLHFLAKMGQKHTFFSKRQSSYPSAVPRPVGDLELNVVFFLCLGKFCRKRPECKPGKTDSHISFSGRTFMRTKRFFISLGTPKSSGRLEELVLACTQDDFQVSSNTSTH